MTFYSCASLSVTLQPFRAPLLPNLNTDEFWWGAPDESTLPNLTQTRDVDLSDKSPSAIR